jgi:putative membrane protein
MSMISRHFPATDLQRVRDEVADAEKQTSGEIVPYIVERSDRYDSAVWRAGMLTSFLTIGLIAILRTTTDLWLTIGVTGTALTGLLAGIIAMFCTLLVPSVMRFFAGKELMDRRVAQRASEAFLAEEVFLTRERTGILVFVSLLEHRITVLGDSGINAKVAPKDWIDIRDQAIGFFRKGRPADGLVAAIRLSAALLVAHGFAGKPDDSNELPDRIRREQR